MSERVKNKPVVLTFLDYYLPGFKAGGPLRTVSNMVDHMAEAIDFRIITRDRDITDSEPYPHIRADAWNPVGGAQVYYASPGQLSFQRLGALVRAILPDVLYLNSFFSTLTIKCLILRRLRRLPPIPVIVAPRGEFSPGALGLKAAKKRPYIAVAKGIGLYRDLLWQASSQFERDEIVAVFDDARVHVAPDMPAALRETNTVPKEKPSGHARFIFLSRITPKKNLHRLLEMLGALSGSIHLSIVGPVSDETYWQRCQETMKRLPPKVQIDTLGSIPHDQVHDVLSGHHFFLLPTLGENFGHVILEAMAAGVPVLVSDQTPWRDLHQVSAGWDIPLEDDKRWLSLLQRCVDMPQAEYDGLSNGARAYAVDWSSDDAILGANFDLFTKAISR